jgi:hypothetical protein
MSIRLLVPAAAALFLIAAASGASAQGAAAPTGTEPQASGESKPARRSRGKREGAAKKERSAGQVAASERRKTCSTEWKEAKEAGKAGGQKWPKFYSACNARLKAKEG